MEKKELFKLGGQEIMVHRVKCLGKIHDKKSHSFTIIII